MMAQLSNYWWFFVLLGVFAGVVSGALGLGSGIVVVPTLVILCSFEQKSAQGTALAVMVPMTLLGAFRYWRNPEIEMNLLVIVLIACGALGGVLVGTELAGRLPSQTLRKIFAIFLVAAAVRMFIASPGPKQRPPGESLTNQQDVNLVDLGGTRNEAEER